MASQANVCPPVLAWSLLKVPKIKRLGLILDQAKLTVSGFDASKQHKDAGHAFVFWPIPETERPKRKDANLPEKDDC